jgi:hypothetical protein
MTMALEAKHAEPNLFVADKADGTAVEEGSDDSVQAPLPKSRFARIYRSTLFNVFIAGMISFTQPGIWNALNSEDNPLRPGIAHTDTS